MLASNQVRLDLRTWTQRIAVAVLGLASHPSWAADLPPAQGWQNLAAGCVVQFAPLPDYGLTARNNTDATDLTDGKLTDRKDLHMWFDSKAVGWSYGGRVNLAMDLGKHCQIEEIAIRLLTGSPSAGISFPGWIEALVSEDGEHYVKVGECSRWRENDWARFGVPEERGKAVIHYLRFTNLQARGRWVGLRFYASGLTTSDEMYVFGKPDAQTTKQASSDSGQSPSDFSVTQIQPYFHKPELFLAKNLPQPVPEGVVAPLGAKGQQTEIRLELPRGVKFMGGTLGDEDLAGLAAEPTQDGLAYRIKMSPKASNKVAARLYLQAEGLAGGERKPLLYSFQSSGWKSPVVALPIRAVTVPAAARPKRLMTSMGWWSAKDTAHWPRALDTWETLGLNTFPLFATWTKEGDPLWKLVDEARRRGFFIANIDSPLHRIAERRKNKPEVFHQFADGKVSDRLCPSYRGEYYREEIRRFAKETGRARPDFASVDIELWGWRGPVDNDKCSRCRADFEASGLKDWDAWLLAKGDEMWRDLVGAARAEVKKAGGPEFEIGGYDFRPGAAYQKLWSVDRQYPSWMQSSQVSTYTCLAPYHLELIGNETRQDRSRLARSDVLPWITPGDAGTFPGEAFQWALLECYTNGARGVWFWSSRVWDSEDLIAYNRVIRALGPVESILIDGALIGETATVQEPGRLSGIRRGNDLVLLVADYRGACRGTVNLSLDVLVRSEIRDLLADSVFIASLQPGKNQLKVPLNGSQARLLHVRTM